LILLQRSEDAPTSARLFRDPKKMTRVN
jgi:hypothetical protein